MVIIIELFFMVGLNINLLLTHSWWRALSYRNQSIDLRSKKKLTKAKSALRKIRKNTGFLVFRFFRIQAHFTHQRVHLALLRTGIIKLHASAYLKLLFFLGARSFQKLQLKSNNKIFRAVKFLRVLKSYLKRIWICATNLEK